MDEGTIKEDIPSKPQPHPSSVYGGEVCRQQFIQEGIILREKCIRICIKLVDKP